MSAGDTLHLGRLTSTYRIAAGSSARAICSRLDQSLVEALPAHLAKAAARPRGDVWLIRRLDVEGSVGLHWTGSRVGRELATCTVAALERTLRRGEDGDNVRWFPDRAAFVAQFLADVARGRAEKRWEYRWFRGGVCDVIANEPRVGLLALTRLDVRDLRLLLRGVEPAGADAVLDAFATETGAGFIADAAVHTVDALRRVLARGDRAGELSGPALALAIVVEVARASSAELSTPDVGAARALAHLAETSRAPDASSRAMLGALTSGDWRALPPGLIDAWHALVGWPDAMRAAAVELVLDHHGRCTPDSGDGGWHTDLGGALLLLPLLADFDWESATAAWPALDGIPAARVAQLLALVSALGAGRNGVAARDPVIQIALGLPDLPDGEVSEWTTRVTPEATQHFVTSFVRDLRALGACGGRVALAEARGSVVAVDLERGHWVGRAAADPVSIAALRTVVDVAFDGAATFVEPADNHLVARLDDQVGHATIGSPFTVAPAVADCTLIAGQALVRKLAWQLPGFAQSTLPYLGENILDFDAHVDIEDGRVVARLGNPPLHLVLSLAGLNRRSFSMPGTGDAQWVLTQRS